MFDALNGIKILDLTSVVVGPVSTLRLGQYGADIIKLEPPSGDLMRELGGKSPTGQHSGTYLHLNRGKKNICIDLKKPLSTSISNRLIEWADVIVANMRPDALERLGIGPNSVRDRYPEKIYCLITGYGTEGPYAGFPTYDSVLQGASGIAGLFQLRDGAPSYVPMLICDHVVGEISAGAIIAALLNRYKTGKGTYIEIPMFETMAAFVLQEHMAQKSFDPPVGPFGDLRLLSPYNKPVKTKDGYISFTINTDTQVSAFLKATGRASLLEDERFKTVASRAIHVNEWFEIRGAALMDKTTEEWLTLLRSVDIPVMPCHSLTSLMNDEHLRAVSLFEKEKHPIEGDSIVIRSTIKSDGAYSTQNAFSQPKGYDTMFILEELGFTQEEIYDILISKTAISYDK
jgi:crotonobetainyl-CoA:carnitine CoA-transferase CaiB-like acyl-CoA transferase